MPAVSLGTNIIHRIVKSISDQLSPKAIHIRPGKPGIFLGIGEPICQRLSAVLIRCAKL